MARYRKRALWAAYDASDAGATIIAKRASKYVAELAELARKMADGKRGRLLLLDYDELLLRPLAATHRVLRFLVDSNALDSEARDDALSMLDAGKHTQDDTDAAAPVTHERHACVAAVAASWAPPSGILPPPPPTGSPSNLLQPLSAVYRTALHSGRVPFSALDGWSEEDEHVPLTLFDAMRARSLLPALVIYNEALKRAGWKTFANEEQTGDLVMALQQLVAARTEAQTARVAAGIPIISPNQFIGNADDRWTRDLPLE
jgi:hypothetical protein